MSTETQSLRIGADIGGTFTDLVFVCPDGAIHKRKVPTTPADYSQAITQGVADFCAGHGLFAEHIGEIVHATTVATNAILERRGARTALLTTEGFRDVLELRRIRIPMSYDLDWRKPAPLVERQWRLGIRERLEGGRTIREAMPGRASAWSISAPGMGCALPVCCGAPTWPPSPGPAP